MVNVTLDWPTVRSGQWKVTFHVSECERADVTGSKE